MTETLYVDVLDTSMVGGGGFESRFARLYCADAELLKAAARAAGIRKTLCRYEPVFHFTCGWEPRAKAVELGAVEVSRARLSEIMAAAAKARRIA